MMTHRCLYIATLVGVLVFHALYPFWISWYLTVLVLLLMPFDLLISLPGMVSCYIALSAPNVVEQGDAATVVVTSLRERAYPLKCIKTRLRVSAEDLKTSLLCILGAESGARYEVEIDSTRSGITFFEIRRIWIVSLLGLFSAPATSCKRVGVLVLPLPLQPPNTVSLPRGTTLRPKPGGGFSEHHDLREYRPGDPVKSIHWKVSAKHDSLIIREPMIPPHHSRLVTVARWDDAAGCDLTLARLRWVCAYLLERDMAFYVRLFDEGPIDEIGSEEDLTEYLYNALSGNAKGATAAALPARFTWEFRVDGGGGGQAQEQEAPQEQPQDGSSPERPQGQPNGQPHEAAKPQPQAEVEADATERQQGGGRHG